MNTTRLGPAYRAQALRDLAEETFDVLVVGGGVTGAGTALDAVSRGLSVALVEAVDWAAGSSGQSSKLIHGGLRYLEQRDFALVREALRERRLLLTRLAPHLVRPVPFLYPLRHRVWERWYVGAGVTLYDTMGGRAREVPRHRHLTRRQVLRMAPALRQDGVVGGIRYVDAQVDDARYTMTLARTAARYGATVTTGTPVTGLLRDGDRVIGAYVLDLESDRTISVRAREVINATGVWADRTQAMLGSLAGPAIRASKGVHILVARHHIDLGTALISRTDRSVLLIMPWGRHWIIGTTDTPWNGDLGQGPVAASDAEVDYLLEQANSVLRSALRRADVDGVYAGLRPLLTGRTADTTKLSREHAVSRPAPGLITVAGGKFTTYRVMARDAVDTAATHLPGPVPAPATERLPLLGAEGYEVLWNERHRLARRAGLPLTAIEHLLGRYGSAIEDLLELITTDPSLGEPIPPATGYLKAEAVYAASHEGARHLDDVLMRRTRAAVEEPDAARAAAPEIADLIAPILGWDEDTVKRELERFHQQIMDGRTAE